MAQLANHLVMTKQGCFQHCSVLQDSDIKVGYNVMIERCQDDNFEMRFRVNVRDLADQEFDELECLELFIINVYEKPQTVLFRKGHVLHLSAAGRFMYCFPQECEGWEATYSLLIERKSTNELILNPSVCLLKNVVIIPDDSENEEPSPKTMTIDGPSINETFIIHF